MARHFKLLEEFREKEGKIEMSKAEDRLEIFRMTIKAADIGHAAKSLDLHEK